MRYLLGLALLVACNPNPTDTTGGPDAYVWELATSKGVFVLDSIDDYIAGMHCAGCIPPIYKYQWCNAKGTGPGYQVKNTSVYLGERDGWTYINAPAPKSPGYFSSVCADSVLNDLHTIHLSDSLGEALKLVVGSRTFTITGNNYIGSSMGYVHASVCAADSTLLWSFADTNGVLYGPYHSNDIASDDGAWRFVRKGNKPQCLPKVGIP